MQTSGQQHRAPKRATAALKLFAKPEKPHPKHRLYEAHLLNVTRKLTIEDQAAVLAFAEQLALNRLERALRRRELADRGRARRPGRQS